MRLRERRLDEHENESLVGDSDTVWHQRKALSTHEHELYRNLGPQSHETMAETQAVAPMVETDRAFR